MYLMDKDEWRVRVIKFVDLLLATNTSFTDVAPTVLGGQSLVLSEMLLLLSVITRQYVMKTWFQLIDPGTG